jgi:hypothetical protein
MPRNLLLWVGALLSLARAFAASAPADWAQMQELSVPQCMLVKLRLPWDLLGASRPALEDLRVLDSDGAEVSYLVEQTQARPATTRPAKAKEVSLTANATVVVIETGTTQMLAGVTVAVPAANFIKPTLLEGSTDRVNWQTLTQGTPLFRLPGGISQLQVALPPGSWPVLRLTLDDRRSEPVPVTGVELLTAAEPAEVVALPASVAARTEAAGDTFLELTLPTANLFLAALEFETPAALFTREVTLTASGAPGQSAEQTQLAQGALYRVAVEGQAASEQLSLPVETQVQGRQLRLRILNRDSPPLPIATVRARCRPRYLLFRAARPGTYRLLTGNRLCAAPRYDLSDLAATLKQIPVQPWELTPLAPNPGFRPPSVVPTVQDTAAPLDTSKWRCRKALALTRPGAQQLEFDLAVMAHAQAGFGDVRIVRGTNQVPFLLEGLTQPLALAPNVSEVPNAKNPSRSCWSLKLPAAHLTVDRIVCAATTPVFQRTLDFWEEVPDARGEKQVRHLASLTWTRTSGQPEARLNVPVGTRLETDTLFVATDNGDNPPLRLGPFELLLPRSRVLFKSEALDGLWLYYGNPAAALPRYDLGLVGNQLRAADAAPVTAAIEESLGKAGWSERWVTGHGGPLFWGALVVVVVALFAIIARLLPRETSPN